MTESDKLLLKANKISKDECPGSCSNSSTCCQTVTGNFACCPYNKGTCCGTHGYCCPEGYTCDDPNKETCLLSDNLLKKPIKLVKPKSTDFKRSKLIVENLSDDQECPDQVNYCDYGYTCCQSTQLNDENIKTGCCASKNAVCCSDGINW